MSLRRLASFVRDRRGVAAVEFALVAPLLISFYLGFSELCSAFMAQKRVGHVSSLVADLIAQDQVVTTDNIDAVFDISNVIMNPYPASNLAQRVRSITLVDGVARVDWSHETHKDGETPEEAAARFDDGPVTLPDDLLQEGQSLIMSEAVYDYRSPIGELVSLLQTEMKAQYYLRPRVVDQVVCTDC